MKYVSLLGKCT